jgi:hypothetical protein
MFRFDTPDFVSSSTQTYGMDIADSSLTAHHRAFAQLLTDQGDNHDLEQA